MRRVWGYRGLVECWSVWRRFGLEIDTKETDDPISIITELGLGPGEPK